MNSVGFLRLTFGEGGFEAFTSEMKYQFYSNLSFLFPSLESQIHQCLMYIKATD